MIKNSLNIKQIILSILLLLILPFNSLAYSENMYFEDEYDEDSYSITEPEPMPEARIQKELVPFNDEQLADIYYAKAVELLKQGNDVKAAEGFMQVLEKQPSYVRARLKLIEVYRGIGWNNEANNILEEGLRIDHDNSKLLVHQAAILIEEKNAEKALSLLLKVKKEEQHDADYKAALAMAYHDLKLYDLAKKNYSSLVRKDMNNAKWWLGLAITMDAQGETAGALRSFKKVKELGGTNASVLRYVQERINNLVALAELESGKNK